MKTIFACAALLAAAGLASAQSPAATATATVGGKTLTIKYSAPSVRGRQIFGDGGLVSKDKTYPVWRAGANSATALHTDADLDIAGLSVPKGDYSLFVLVKDPNAWELIVSKMVGKWGLNYDASQDLGRVEMTMSKPSTPVEMLYYDLKPSGANQVKMDLAWENHAGSVMITVK